MVMPKQTRCRWHQQDEQKKHFFSYVNSKFISYMNSKICQSQTDFFAFKWTIFSTVLQLLTFPTKTRIHFNTNLWLLANTAILLKYMLTFANDVVSPTQTFLTSLNVTYSKIKCLFQKRLSKYIIQTIHATHINNEKTWISISMYFVKYYNNQLP